MPAWGGAAELWKQYLSGWHPTGLGSDTGSPPYVGVLALLSTVLLGNASAESVVGAAGCSRYCGTMARGCACSPSAWSAGASSGHRPFRAKMRIGR